MRLFKNISLVLSGVLPLVVFQTLYLGEAVDYGGTLVKLLILLIAIAPSVKQLIESWAAIFDKELDITFIDCTWVIVTGVSIAIIIFTLPTLFDTVWGRNRS